MLDINIVERDNRIIVIHVKGNLYSRTLKQIESPWREQVAKNPRIIAIDCMELEHIDSSAISALVQFLNEAMKKKIKIVFYDLSKGLRQLFEVARLEKFFIVTTKDVFEEKYLLAGAVK